MKKIMAVVLAALMLLSCVTIVSADSPKRVVITACDDLAGWSNNDKPFAENNVPEPALSTDLADYPVVSFTYTGAVHGNGGWGRPAEQISEMQGTKIAYKAETPFDLTGMNYVIFDVYVSNAAALSGVKFYMELTSGGQPDKEEIGFQMTLAEMKGSELVDGWNHIELALAASNTKYGDPINWSAWNFLRIYNGTNYDAGEGLTIAFKNLYFCEVSVAAQQAQAAAQSIIDLYTPIAEISSGDITAENYESVKSQLAAAIAAYNSAEVAIQSAVTEVVDASKIERNVTRALEKYEEEMDQPAEPDTPDTPTPEVPAEDEPTDTDTPATDTPATDAPATDAPATDDAAATDDVAEGETNYMTIYFIIGGAALLIVIVVVVIIVSKKKK